MRFAFAASLVALIAVPLAASTMPSRNSQPSLSNREQQVWSSRAHHAQFADVPHTTRTSCDASEPPQELTAPNPELDEQSAAKIEVSFIVGSDGHVHSPLILESAGPEQDSKVLRTVSKWRFRPATCDGVATDAEAKIAFSAR
jgi:TonB family protein